MFAYQVIGHPVRGRVQDVGLFTAGEDDVVDAAGLVDLFLHGPVVGHRLFAVPADARRRRVGLAHGHDRSGGRGWSLVDGNRPVRQWSGETSALFEEYGDDLDIATKVADAPKVLTKDHPLRLESRSFWSPGSGGSAGYPRLDTSRGLLPAVRWPVSSVGGPLSPLQGTGGTVAQVLPDDPGAELRQLGRRTDLPVATRTGVPVRFAHQGLPLSRLPEGEPVPTLPDHPTRARMIRVSCEPVGRLRAGAALSRRDTPYCEVRHNAAVHSAYV